MVTNGILWMCCRRMMVSGRCRRRRRFVATQDHVKAFAIIVKVREIVKTSPMTEPGTSTVHEDFEGDCPK